MPTLYHGSPELFFQYHSEFFGINYAEQQFREGGIGLYLVDQSDEAAQWACGSPDSSIYAIDVNESDILDGDNSLRRLLKINLDELDLVQFKEWLFNKNPNMPREAKVLISQTRQFVTNFVKSRVDHLHKNRETVIQVVSKLTDREIALFGIGEINTAKSNRAHTFGKWLKGVMGNGYPVGQELCKEFGQLVFYNRGEQEYVLYDLEKLPRVKILTCKNEAKLRAHGFAEGDIVIEAGNQPIRNKATTDDRLLPRPTGNNVLANQPT